MTKKLSEYEITSRDGPFINVECNTKIINTLVRKINELVDAVNELQNRIDPPSVYQVMKDKDAIIGKHIGEKQRLQDELERTHKALDRAKLILKNLLPTLNGYERLDVEKSINEITALEQKD